MAIQIYPQAHQNQTYRYTSEHLDAVLAVEDNESVVATVKHTAEDGDTSTLLWTLLQPTNGIVKLCDISSLVADHFRKAGLVTGDITVSIGTYTTVIKYMYSDFALPGDFDPCGQLLLSSVIQQVHPEDNVVVAAIPQTPHKYLITVYGFRDGEYGVRANWWTSQAPMDDAHTTEIPVAKIIDIATGVDDSLETTADALSEVTSFIIRYGDNQKAFYIAKEEPLLSFKFRNQFNVPEFLSVFGTVDSDVKAKQSEAIVGGSVISYDRNITATYEVKTGIIQQAELGALSQMLTSYDVSLLQGENEDCKIVITDYEFVPTTADDSMCIATFKFRFADAAPRRLVTNHERQRPGNAFSAQFSPEYD